jgi:uncharacterized RDD family membrane protein YckC
MFCPQCGTPANDAAFCPSCGASMSGTPAVSQSASSATGTVDPGTGLVLSGWWRRAGASVVDSLIVLIPTLLLGAVGVPGYISDVILFGYLYYFWTNRGATIGNRATDTKVVSETGGSIDSNSAVIRGLILCLPQLISSIVTGDGVGVVGTGTGLAMIVSVFYLIDFLMPLWDGRRQSIHDKVAKTLVVRA